MKEPCEHPGSFIWSIADQLRGPYRPNQYGKVILPFTILRRLDCILEPTARGTRAREAVKNPTGARSEVKRDGRPFYNTSTTTSPVSWKTPTDWQTT